MKAFLIAIIFAISAPSVAQAVGYASNANFLIYSPSAQSAAAEKLYADSVLKEAERFRKEFAIQWLGQELPRGAGRSVVYIDFSQVDDKGLTWAKDHRDRLLHNVWLTTSPERAAGSTLRHEVAHTVLATRYPHPNRLAPWAEEGIACRYDDEGRKERREQYCELWAQAGNAPSLSALLESPDLKSLDESGYAASAALVSYLLTLGNETQIVRFAEDGQRIGWEAALRSHYDIQSRRQLQIGWQNWLASRPPAAPRAER